MKKFVAIGAVALALGGLAGCSSSPQVSANGTCTMDPDRGEFSIEVTLKRAPEDGIYPVRLSIDFRGLSDGVEVADSSEFIDLPVQVKDGSGNFYNKVSGDDLKGVTFTECLIFDKGENGNHIGSLEVKNTKSFSALKREYHKVQVEKERERKKAEQKRKVAREKKFAIERAQGAAIRNELTTSGAAGMSTSQVKEKFGPPLHTQESDYMNFWYYEQKMPNGKTLNAQVVFEYGVVTVVNRSVYDFR